MLSRFFNDSDSYNINFAIVQGIGEIKNISKTNIKKKNIKGLLNYNIVGFINIKNINSGELVKLSSTDLKNAL
jgi:hypothetical protein